MPTIQTRVRSMSDQDGAVLLDLEGGKYYSLNGVGADIWNRLEEGKELPDILEDLTTIYRAPRERLEKDLNSFVSGLQEKGLIHVNA